MTIMVIFCKIRPLVLFRGVKAIGNHKHNIKTSNEIQSSGRDGINWRCSIIRAC